MFKCCGKQDNHENYNIADERNEYTDLLDNQNNDLQEIQNNNTIYQKIINDLVKPGMIVTSDTHISQINTQTLQKQSEILQNTHQEKNDNLNENIEQNVAISDKDHSIMQPIDDHLSSISSSKSQVITISHKSNSTKQQQSTASNKPESGLNTSLQDSIQVQVAHIQSRSQSSSAQQKSSLFDSFNQNQNSNLEIQALRIQLAQQQVFFEKTMEIMKQQQQQIQEHQLIESQNRELLNSLHKDSLQNSLRQSVKMSQSSQSENNASNSTLTRSNVLNYYNKQYNDSLQINYNTDQVQYKQNALMQQTTNVENQTQRQKQLQKAKLMLTSNSICGYDENSIKLFEIDLHIKNVVKFDDDRRRIIIQHPEGPLAMTSISVQDYFKWRDNIMASINKCATDVETKQIIMKIDTSKKQLLVFKGTTTIPLKAFQIQDCNVEVKKQGDQTFVKVRCVDGRKFQFGDKAYVCEQWIMQLKRCGGKILHL